MCIRDRCETCGASYEGRAALCPLDRGRLREVADPLIGRSIAGVYTVEAKIGQGVIASVYRARREGAPPAGASAPLAIKVLAPALARSPKLRERFLREARAAGCVRHEHVIEIVDAGETEDGVVFLSLIHI